MRTLGTIALQIALLLATPLSDLAEETAIISFNRDVRPILSEHCFSCHGPNKAKGGLRFNSEQAATNVLSSGHVAIIPGDTEKSELLRRVTSSDQDERMPPREIDKPLTQSQIQILRRWIAQGARWEQHWAFKPIRRPSVPRARFPERARNPIDTFIQQQFAEAGLSPNPRADPRTLARRIYFDLLGLPPTDREIAQLGQENGYERLVERALASPHFGERMAVWWLDLVRYADTEGYHSDKPRSVYVYRDYIIRAFNRNKPFNQFTLEQLAGDLLAPPTASPAPFDPENPWWDERIGSGYNRLLLTTRENGANAKQYFAKYDADRVRNFSSVWLGLTFACAECHDHKYDPIKSRDFYSMAAFFADIKEVGVGPQVETCLPRSQEDADLLRLKEEEKALREDFRRNHPHRVAEKKAWLQSIQSSGTVPAPWQKDKEQILRLTKKYFTGKLSRAEQADLNTLYLRSRPLPADTLRLREITQRKSKLSEDMDRTLMTEAGVPRLIRLLPRGNWLDESGEILLPAFPQLGIPSHDLMPIPEGNRSETCPDYNSGQRLTRLDLALWAVSPENPLTARVLANRLWQLFLGEGLVRTADDFGAQGEAPTHPELLDWLASELLVTDWDIKHLIRLILESYTYQQSSNPRAEDPANRLFARQSTFMISAEFIRDNALAISDLLSPGMGGLPVRLSARDAANTEVDGYNLIIKPEEGERHYRRGVYVNWRRSALNPSLAAFNAPNREECVVQRNQTRGPQQALTLLNDPVYLEAACALGERIMRAASDPEARVEAAFRFALGRPPRGQETMLLLELEAGLRESFVRNPIGAAQFVRVGQYRLPTGLDICELAAWANVARTILNLEETMTRY